MALAALREAMGQAAALESSEGIEQSEGLAAVMLAYAPMGFDDFESRFRQSPWAFYNTTDLCISILEGTVLNPKRFLDRIFDHWQEFQKDDTRNSENNRHHNQSGDDSALEASLGRGEISSSVATPHDAQGLTTQTAPVEDTINTSSQTPLVGAALIKKVKAMGDSTPGDQARGCGYILSGQPQTGDVEAFYAALYEAYRAVRK